MTTPADLTRLAFGLLNSTLVLPPTPPMLISRMASESLVYTPNVVESPELDTSGQLAESVFVGSSSAGAVEFPLVRSLWLHEMLAAQFRNNWGTGNILGDSAGLFASRAVGANELIPAKLMKLYAVQKKFETDAGPQYQLHDRVGINGLSLRVQPQEIITGSLSLMGGVMTPSNTDITGAVYADPGDYKTFTAPNVTEVNIEGMPLTQCFNSLTLSFSSNLRSIPCIGQESDKTKGLGRFVPTLEGTTYFESNAHVTALKAQSALKVSVTLTDGSGNSYKFFFPRMKFTAAPVTTPGTNQDVMQPISMRAHYAEDYGYSCLLTRVLAP